MSGLFSPANIQKAVHDTLDEATAAIPPGDSAALLIDGTTEGKAQILFAVKAGNGWNLGTGVSYDGHHVAGKVSLLRTWK